MSSQRLGRDPHFDRGDELARCGLADDDAVGAADALGPDRVWCVMLPSRFTGQLSLDLATECARMIGCRYDTIPIAPAVRPW